MQQLTHNPRATVCDDCGDTIEPSEPFYASIDLPDIHRRCLSCDDQRLEEREEDQNY